MKMTCGAVESPPGKLVLGWRVLVLPLVLPLVAGAGGGVVLAGFWALAALAKDNIAAVKRAAHLSCMTPPTLR
jgi:hypothetical protein